MSQAAVSKGTEGHNSGKRLARLHYVGAGQRLRDWRVLPGITSCFVKFAISGIDNGGVIGFYLDEVAVEEKSVDDEAVVHLKLWKQGEGES